MSGAVMLKRRKLCTYVHLTVHSIPKMKCFIPLNYHYTEFNDAHLLIYRVIRCYAKWDSIKAESGLKTDHTQ